MGMILKEYDGKVEKCWYDSTNVIYSECLDNKDALKDVKVVFKDGRTYMYQGVPVNNYLMFRSDISQGKSLYKYIAYKVKGVDKHVTLRIENTDLTQLEKQKQLLIEKTNKNEQ